MFNKERRKIEKIIHDEEVREFNKQIADLRYILKLEKQNNYELLKQNNILTEREKEINKIIYINLTTSEQKINKIKELIKANDNN